MIEFDVHRTYCHCRNPQFIIATTDLHIIQQALTSKTSSSRKIQVANNNYKKRK